MLSSADKARFRALQELGCICCRKLGVISRPIEVHHLVEGRRRLGHQFTLPLCAYHHRGQSRWDDMRPANIYNTFGPSLHHHGSADFEQRWGTQQALLTEVNDLLRRSL